MVDAASCATCGQVHARCGGHAKTGEPCNRPPSKGATVCLKHGAGAPQVAAKAAVRAEVMAWGLGNADVDPGEVLLRLVSQSAARAQRYAEEIEALVAESPSLHEALVAEVWQPSEDGGSFKSGEYIRGLAQLEAAERDRCAGFAAKAIAAGLAERQVRLAERQGALIADVLRSVLNDPDLGLTAEQRRLATDVTRRHLHAVAG